MIFVGKKENGFFGEEFCNSNGIPFEYAESSTSILNQTNEILKLGKHDYTIFDVTQYCDDANVVFEEVNRICAANTSQCIIYAPGYNPGMKLPSLFLEHGMKKFIFSINMTDMKDELEKCINGYKDTIDYSITKADEATVSIKETPTKLIGVVGVCSRIGTTTHAVQLVKYLQFLGKKACYIQMNSSDYVDYMINYCMDVEIVDKELGCFKLENVEHYYKLDKLESILKLDYEYFIYDYGIYADPNFNRLSFTEKNYKFVVLGKEADEIVSASHFMESSYYNNVSYIFNFCAESDRTLINELMDNSTEEIHIAPYIPDKYTLKDIEFYQKLLPVMAANDTNKNNKVFHLWGRKNAKV